MDADCVVIVELLITYNARKIHHSNTLWESYWALAWIQLFEWPAKPEAGCPEPATGTWRNVRDRAPKLSSALIKNLKFLLFGFALRVEFWKFKSRIIFCLFEVRRLLQPIPQGIISVDIRRWKMIDKVQMIFQTSTSHDKGDEICDGNVRYIFALRNCSITVRRSLGATLILK